MRLTARIASALAIVAAFSAPALAGDVRTDRQIVKDVSNAVMTYVRYTVFDDISVSVDQGAVILSGRVTMPFKKTDIEKRVSQVPGVTHVEDKVTVLPVSMFDDDLRYVIARAIYSDSAFTPYAAMPNPPVHVIVENGQVTLTGVVNSNVQRTLALAIASRFNGFSVTNELKTDEEVRAALTKSFDAQIR